MPALTYYHGLTAWSQQIYQLVATTKPRHSAHDIGSSDLGLGSKSGNASGGLLTWEQIQNVTEESNPDIWESLFYRVQMDQRLEKSISGVSVPL